MKINKALLKWTISKGRDTYGYNVATLTDCDTGDKFKTIGGGYDMTGTVFADWIESIYQPELLAIANEADSKVFYENGKYVNREYNQAGKRKLYGMTAYYSDGKLDKVNLDGACGLSSIEDIVKAMGLTIEKVYDRSKKNPVLTAFYVFKE